MQIQNHCVKGLAEPPADFSGCDGGKGYSASPNPQHTLLRKRVQHRLGSVRGLRRIAAEYDTEAVPWCVFTD